MRATADLPLFAAAPSGAARADAMPRPPRHPLDLGGVRHRAVVFASGSNAASEVLGFAAVGLPVGVTAPHVGEGDEAALLRLARECPDAELFVDTGAYGAFRAGRTLGDAEWRVRLALITRLARAFGPRLSAVAPDVVANQDATLAVLARYADVVRGWLALGAYVLLPVQGGRATPGAFYAALVAALGLAPDDPARRQLVPAFPMRAASTAPSAVTAFLAAEAAAGCAPARLHLLGLGWESALAKPLVRGLAHVAPDTRVSMDSCLIVAAVGRANGAGGGRRALTAAQDGWRAFGATGPSGAAEDPGDRRLWWDDAYDPAFGAGGDYTDHIAHPSTWLSPAGLARVADALDAALGPKGRYVGAGRFTAAARRCWLADPDAFCRVDRDAKAATYRRVRRAGPGRPEEDAEFAWGEHPILTELLDQEWQRWLTAQYTARRKAAAIAAAFRGHPAAWQFAPLNAPEILADADALRRRCASAQ